jgi:copper chaperone CopZ
MPEVAYTVKGIMCQGCVNAIENALASMSGVLDIKADLNTKRITVDYNDRKLGPEQIKARIENAGYEAEQA